MAKEESRQAQIIKAVFFDRYSPGVTSIQFTRPDLFDACEKHGIKPLKNMGDGPIYAYRYRKAFPDEILATQPNGKEWVVLGRGIAKYEFRLVSSVNIEPNPHLVSIKIPDATPEIIKSYAFSDEQALLAKIRYNRLTDMFFGIVAYSLQNHLRTTVEAIGQIEIDEIYVGLDRHGRHFVIPGQAKVGKDKIGYAQLYQDLAYCRERYQSLVVRALSAKFMEDGIIAMFELTIDEDSVRIVQEKHYALVPKDNISETDLESYVNRVTK